MPDAIPSRVEALSAGLSLPDYVQMLSSEEIKNSLPDEFNTNLDVMERRLRRIFRDQDFGFDYVVDQYLAGRGSNTVLERAMKEYPAHVFRWFRVGQVTSHIIGNIYAAPEDVEKGIISLGLNLSAIGAAQEVVDEISSLTRSVWFGYAPDVKGGPSEGETLKLQSLLFERLTQMAAQQDEEAARPNNSSVVIGPGAVYIGGNASGAAISTNVRIMRWLAPWLRRRT